MADFKESPFLNIIKVAFAVVAMVSLFFVIYNIGVYTNDSEIEAFVVSR